MKWPNAPTCHGDPTAGGIFKFAPPHWRELTPEDQPYGRPFRSCSFCGSIHPEDLLEQIKTNGTKLGGADWKYGWPHKFYIEGIQNPQAGKMVRVGSKSGMHEDGTRYDEPIIGAASAHSRAKWYNDHLLDDGYDDEAMFALLISLKTNAGIEFFFKDGKLGYRAPYAGYQR